MAFWLSTPQSIGIRLPSASIPWCRGEGVEIATHSNFPMAAHIRHSPMHTNNPFRTWILRDSSLGPTFSHSRINVSGVVEWNEDFCVPQHTQTKMLPYGVLQNLKISFETLMVIIKMMEHAWVNLKWFNSSSSGESTNFNNINSSFHLTEH